MLGLSEVSFVRKAGLAGTILVDKIFSNRGLTIVPGLTIRLDQSEIERNNPDFDIEIDTDKNIISYALKDKTINKRSDEVMRFTAYFDNDVEWPAIP